MRKLRNILVAGGAALVLGLTSASAAELVIVQAPGAIPVSVIQPANAQAPALTLVPLAAFDNSFADFNRIAAVMDRDIDQMMMRQSELMNAMQLGVIAPDQPALTEASFGKLPAGVNSVTRMLSSQGSCMQSVEISTSANGKQNVVSKTSGDCRGVPALSVALPGVAQTGTAAPLQVKDITTAQLPARKTL